jgi:hypothetical protein
VALEIDLRSVADGTTPNIEAGAELLAFADGLGLDPSVDLTPERDALIARLGRAATERAAGVAATFQMMNRLLDVVGAPVNNRPHLEPIAEALGYHLADIPR